MPTSEQAPSLKLVWVNILIITATLVFVVVVLLLLFLFSTQLLRTFAEKCDLEELPDRHSTMASVDQFGARSGSVTSVQTRQLRPSVKVRLGVGHPGVEHPGAGHPGRGGASRDVHRASRGGASRQGWSIQGWRIQAGVGHPGEEFPGME